MWNRLQDCFIQILRYALCYTVPVYRNAISVGYLVLTILHINSSSSLRIIGYVTELKEYLMGHRTLNCHISDVVRFIVHISHIKLDAVILDEIFRNIRFGS